MYTEAVRAMRLRYDITVDRVFVSNQLNVHYNSVVTHYRYYIDM